MSADTRTLAEILRDCQALFATFPPVPEEAPKPERPKANNTSIPASFEWAKLGAPELWHRVGRKLAIDEAKRALEGHSLTLLGGAGAGKTSLAVALLHAYDETTRGAFGFFCPAYKLGMARIQSKAGDGEAAIVERAMTAPLLVLDDIGSERQTANNAVPDVIFERAYAGRPTWVTTGLSPQDIAARYGDGVVRRLYEGGRVLVVNCSRGEK